MTTVYDRLNMIMQKFTKLGITAQLDFPKLYLYSLITHSTAIEGSTLSETENTIMFDEGIVPGGHNLTEQLMNLDLKRAYDHVFSILNSRREITVDFLKHLSALVMKNTGSIYNTALGTFDSSAGDLRLVNVSAGRGGRSYLSYQKVPPRLQDFCLWLNAERRKQMTDAAAIYAMSFEAHYRLVTIHPWADGNGRTCRLLMNMLQLEQGLLPSILKRENKAKYIEALAVSQDSDNSKVFVEFMLESMVDSLKVMIREYVDGN
ncbi:MAG: Fic family protein [Selenomonadaceae bacterium]|nr:Fic family protein [Selenomonadaceae bacterium]